MKGFIWMMLFVVFFFLLLFGSYKIGFLERAPATPESDRLNALNEVVPANFEHVHHVNLKGQAVIKALDKEQLLSKAEKEKQSKVFLDGDYKNWKLHYVTQVTDTTWFTFQEDVKFPKAPACMGYKRDVALDKNGQVFMTVERFILFWYLWEYGFPILISVVASAIVCTIIVHGLSRQSPRPEYP